MTVETRERTSFPPPPRYRWVPLTAFTVLAALAVFALVAGYFGWWL